MLLACNENRLVEVKGFGYKTQEDIKHKIEFFLSSTGKYHYASVEGIANELLQALKMAFPNEKIELTGSLRRKMPIVDSIELISTTDLMSHIQSLSENEDENKLTFKDIPVTIISVPPSAFGTKWFESSCSETFLQSLGGIEIANFAEEQEVFQALEIPYIDPCFRESKENIEIVKNNIDFKLIELSDIKGVIHNHSTYSDGLSTLKEMAHACQTRGYDYFVISDHSVSAFYANGLSIERVEQQWREIDELNKKLHPFKIYKSIESDILNDGSLDYPDDILEGFDLVIASVHSNLKMDEAKATARLITAIENKYTDILGHPTGRLLLGRSGYAIDHKKVIDACAQNNVALELNANPQRLDIDWEWIPYALKKEVKIAINPDAHSTSQIDFIKYGLNAACKGGLTKKDCINAMDINAFEKWLER